MKDKLPKRREFAKRLKRDMPNAELKLWQGLRRKQIAGQNFRRQHPIGSYVVDFACIKERLIVEIDGADQPTEDEKIRDEGRTDYLAAQGWRVIRFNNIDVYKNVESVLAAIAGHLSTATKAERI